MTNIISTVNNHIVVHRPRLCHSNQQPNLLEYIDTTLNETFSLNLTLTRTITNEYDQFGNTILDQYLLYLLCQKINPNRRNNLNNEFYQLLHQLIIFNGKISKAFFQYSSLMTDRIIFNSYTNFIWNELDVNVLLELGCFLLKYRLRDIFSIRLQNMTGYFLEIIAIYYLFSNHPDYFRDSRSIDMIFPSPWVDLFSSSSSSSQIALKINEQITFEKFLQAIHNNGEIYFDIYHINFFFKNNLYQFINKKLENKKNDFMKFLFQIKNSCHTLKSICRIKIKMNIKQYPNDIKKLNLFPAINDRLQHFLIYENSFAFESYI